MTLKKYKTLFGVLAVLLVALVTGVAVGKIYVDSIPVNIILNATEAELRDSDEIIEELVERSKKENPTAFTAVELYEIAEYNFNQKDAYYKTSNGRAINLVGAQTLRSYRLLRDGEFVFDNLSPGMIDVCTRVRYTVGEETATRNTEGKYTDSSKTKGSFDSAYDEEYTLEEYYEKFNCYPTSGVTYLISTKTCPEDACSKVTKTSDGNYTFTISLSGTYLTAAAYRYSYEIFYTSYGVLTSEAKENIILPAWEDMKMTVVIDENFDFVEISYDENYKVNTKFGYQSVNDVFTEKFVFDVEQMPLLEEVL